ncbi:Thioredoxin [Minicystis rosea]|nr:Thioredoxin [Minicystis rosea]
MRSDGLLGLSTSRSRWSSLSRIDGRARSARLVGAGLVAFSLAACSRPDATAQPEPAATAEPPAAAAPSPTVGPLAALVGETWNAAEIDWQSYEAGLAKAKAEKKPICLVLYTGWCPHCRNYSRVFDDAKVVAQAKRFVMIRVNADDHGDVAAKFQPDGGYVPRTFFLSPDGQLAADIKAPRPKFQYFFDERNPASLLEGMAEAARKFIR